LTKSQFVSAANFKTQIRAGEADEYK